MKRGEVTIAVMADYSKAFDTVAYETVLIKLHQLGFSKSSLMWIASYLTGLVNQLKLRMENWKCNLHLIGCYLGLCNAI